jgi:hypothetical protein
MENNTLKNYEEIYKRSITDGRLSGRKRQRRSLGSMRERRSSIHLIHLSTDGSRIIRQTFATTVLIDTSKPVGEVLALIAESAYSEKVYKYTYNE